VPNAGDCLNRVLIGPVKVFLNLSLRIGESTIFMDLKVNHLNQKGLNMKKSFTYFLACCLLATACSKDFRIRRKEDKLIGSWQFEKVYYKRDNALFRDNITDEFDGDIIEFFPNYGALYDDVSLRATFQGDWQIYADKDVYYTDDGSDSEWEFFLDMCFDDFIAGDSFCYFGSICRLNQNKLTIEAEDRRGKYTFKLRRY